jgi:glycosyltransferase involved in cell wall biosynthesis
MATKVLLSAYACEPGRGSEPEVGWQWAIGLAGVTELTVLTRSNNRQIIEQELKKTPHPHPAFLYYDLPKPFLFLKKIGLPAPIYYLLWQIGASILIFRLRQRFDIIQHLTFNSFLFPGFLWFSSPAVILGPLGGGMTTAPFHLHWFGKSAIGERLRTAFVKLARFNPLLRLSLHFAKHIWVANADTKAKLPPFAHSKTSILLETAAPVEANAQSQQPPKEEPEPKNPEHSSSSDASSISAFQHFSVSAPSLLFIGRLEPRKAPALAIHLLKLLEDHFPNLTLTIVGEGPLQDDLKKLTSELGLNGRVRFLSRVPKEHIPKLMRAHSALIFPSVRDTSGNVVLEAMANGLPVVAFRHQGVVQMLDDETGYLIEPKGSPIDLENFAKAVKEILTNPTECARRISCALSRTRNELAWRSKWPQVLEIYQDVLKSAQVDDAFSAT